MTEADEVIVPSAIFGHDARFRPYELLAANT